MDLNKIIAKRVAIVEKKDDDKDDDLLLGGGESMETQRPPKGETPKMPIKPVDRKRDLDPSWTPPIDDPDYVPSNKIELSRALDALAGRLDEGDIELFYAICKRGFEKLGEGLTNEGVKDFDWQPIADQIPVEKGTGTMSASGARQMALHALWKLRAQLDLPEEERQAAIFGAVNDYIDYLASSGELSDEEVSYLRVNPGYVARLNGFREFFNKYQHRALRKWKKKHGGPPNVDL